MKNIYFVSIFVILMVGIAGAEHACVADDGSGDAYFCGDTVNTVTKSCTFNGSMNCAAGAGLIIGADDIAINGADFRIIGNRGNLSCGWCDECMPAEHSGIVNTEYSNITIKNLEIENFCTGIVLGQTPPEVSNNTVTGCNIHNCGNSSATTHGIHLIGVNDCTITKNEICNIDGEGMGGGCGGGGNGIFMYGVGDPHGNYNSITYNNLSYNSKSGFFMKKRCMHNTISNNTAVGNPEGGVVLMCMGSNYNAIESNNASGSGSGIVIGGRNNTIRYNTVLNNLYYGIKMSRSDGSYNNEVRVNTVCGNGVADIKTCGPECYGNHGDNNTCNTTSNYDDDGTTGCTFDCSPELGACVADDGSAFLCGDTVTKSCTLNGTMICPNGSAGLIIGADNIVIDGNNYTVTGSTINANCEWAGEAAPCTVSGIYNAGYDNVVIKNLEIESFCTGIALKGTGQNKVHDTTIDNCKIHDNGFSTASETGSEMITHGIHACYVRYLEITENDIYNNDGTGSACGDGGNGIFIYAGVSENYCDISHNKLYDNAKAGFWTKMKLSRSNITHNEVWGNGNGSCIYDDVRGGIVLRCKMSNETLIACNDVHDHAAGGYGYGIYIGGSNNTIRHNTVTGNSKHGISMARSDGSFDNELYNNVVCNNSVDISVTSSVTGNNGCNNTCNTTHHYNDDGSTGCTHTCGRPQPLGDLNGDYKITAADAAIALQMAVRGEYSEDADVSGDSRVTSLDALLILQVAEGI